MKSFSRTDVQVYERFRAWVNKQPPEEQQGEPLDAYRRVLAAEGLSASETERQIRLITDQGQKLEIDRWNRIFTAPTATFNTKPHGFLLKMTYGLSPGNVLDVGMGQGRHALLSGPAGLVGDRL